MENITSSLSGIAYSEKLSETYKSVCTVVGRLNCSKEEVEAFISGTIPKNNFEKFIVIKLIDKYKLHDAFIKALLSEEPMMISHLLKCHWFFKDEQDLLSDPAKFIKDIYSKISTSNQSRVLKMYGRYLKDHVKADALFRSLLDLYGQNRILNVLPACSEGFIREVLYKKRKDKFAVLVPGDILEQLFLYHNTFTCQYLFDYFKMCQKSSSHIYVSEYKPILLRLLVKDPKLFIDLFIQYDDVIFIEKLGKALTRKLIKSDYPSILDNPIKFCRLFHPKVLVSCCTQTQLEEFILRLMPKSVDAFIRDANSYRGAWPLYLQVCESLSHNSGGTLIMKHFQGKYGYPISEANPPYEFVELLPEPDRVLWAKKRLSKPEISDEDRITFSAYLSPSEAFPALEKLCTTALTVESRRAIIESMIHCIKIHSRVELISDVFAFVNKRLRNDNAYVRAIAISKSASLKLSLLSIEQWTPIIELIDNLLANDDICHCRSEVIQIYQKWVLKRLSMSLSVDDEIRRIIGMCTFNFDFKFAENTPYAKLVLSWFTNNLPNFEFDNDRFKNNIVIGYFSYLCEWNQKHPKDQIPIDDWYLSVIKECFNKRIYASDVMEALSFNPVLKQDLAKEYFVQVASPELFLYILKLEARCLLDKKSEVFTKISDGIALPYKHFLKRLNFYPTVPLAQEMINLSLETLKSEDSTTGVKQACIFILSHLADNSSFLSVIEQYLPVDSQALMDTPDNVAVYRIRQTVAAQLKELNPPSSAIPAVSRFCKGDYLKMVIGTFCSVMLNIPEEKALLVLSANLDTPVSFRKHVLRLIRKVAPISMACDNLLSAFTAERNVSLRKILLETLYDMLSKEESLIVWNSLGKALSSLNEEDIKRVNTIFDLRPIPEQFLAFYIESIWAVLHRIRETNDYTQKIFELINHETINVLSEDFCDILFSLCYIEGTGDAEPVLSFHHSFISLYLFRSSEIDIATRISKIITFLKKTILPSWNKVDIKSKKLCVQQVLSSLVQKLCYNSLEEWAQNPASVLLAFQKGLILLLPEEDAITDHFLLSLFNIYHRLSQTDKSKALTLVASEIFSLVDKFVNTFGCEMISVLKPIVENFILIQFDVGEGESSTANVFRFIELALTSPTVSRVNKVMAIDFIPSLDNMDDDVPNYKDILTILDSLSDPSLKLYARYTVFK